MNNDFFQSYQTAEWQRLKNRVLERDNYTCQICGERHGLMQVHHITYKRCSGKAYNAPMGDLITLCENCHCHDDGDHKHFFNGGVTINSGHFGQSPSVLSFLSIFSKSFKEPKWYGEIGDIIFAVSDRGNECVGFRSCNHDPNWFEYFLGASDEGGMWYLGDLPPEAFSEQRFATFKEVDKFVQAIESEGGRLSKFSDVVFRKETSSYEDKWCVNLLKYCLL